MSNIVQIVSPDDIRLLAFLGELKSNDSFDTINVSLGPDYRFNIVAPNEWDDLVAVIGEGQSRRILTFDFSSSQSRARCEFVRGAGGSENPRFSTFLAEFRFKIDDRQNHAPDKRSRDLRFVSDLIAKHFLNSIAEINPSGDASSDVIAMQVEKMSSVALSVSQHLARAQIEYDQRLQEHRKKVDEQAEEAEAKRLALYAEQMSELREQEKDLQTRSAALDLRRARDARRQLRDDITKGLEERLSSPPAPGINSSARGSVLNVAFLGIGIFVLLGGAAIAELAGVVDRPDSDIELYLIYIRLFASTAMIAALLFYLLGYFKKLEASDTKYERDLERFSLDINRASWVIETVMEFRDEENGLRVPDEWLKNATANMFGASKSDEDDDEKALEALGALLQTGAKLKLGPAGAELELDSAAAKKTGKSV